MKKFSFVWHLYHSIFSAKTQSKITLDNLARMYKRPTKQTFKCSAKAADPYSFIIICLYEKINKVVKFERFPVKMKKKLDAPKNRRRRGTGRKSSYHEIHSKELLSGYSDSNASTLYFCKSYRISASSVTSIPKLLV